MVKFSANRYSKNIVIKNCIDFWNYHWRDMAFIDTSFFGCILLLLLVHMGLVLASENDVDDINRRVVLVGTNLKLPCSPGAEDTLEYFTWSKNGVLLPDHSSTALQSRFIIQSDYSLLIVRVAEDDEGNYSCSIQSYPPQSISYNVQVEVPAAIDELLHHGVDLQHYQLREGGDLDLVCMASGRPLPTVTWKYQGKVLSAKESIIDVNQKVSSVHRIVGARKVDAGAYICEADNGVDIPAVATFNVEISHAPEIAVEHSWVHTGLGSLTELACTVYAQPAAQITWFRSVESVGNNEGERKHLQVIPSNRVGTLVMANGLKHVLRFKSVRDADLGIYTCKAENAHGQAEAAIEMSGKAMAAVLWISPPRGAHKSADSEQQEDDDSKGQRISYRLTWDAVSISPIYEYRLWLRPRGQPEISWVNLIIPSNSSTGSSSPSLHSHGYELFDLATGIVYQVSVQSRNRFGWSAESNTVNLSGGDDPEVTDYDDNIPSSSISNIPADQSSSASADTTTTTATLPITSDSSSILDDNESTIETSVEVTKAEETTEDNQSTLPALVIDPVSVDQYGTHEQVHTMEPPTSPTQSPSESPTPDGDLCPPGHQDCGDDLANSKDPENLPSSISSPGNRANNFSRPWITSLLAAVVCSMAAHASFFVGVSPLKI